jgi:hypothetical protein
MMDRITSGQWSGITDNGRRSRLRALAALAAVLVFWSCPAGPEVPDNYLWRFDMGGTGVSSPVADADGHVLVLTYDGRLYAVVPADGRISWQMKFDDVFVTSPAVDTDGAIYVKSGSGCVYKIAEEAEEPRLVWTFREAAYTRTTTEPLAIGKDTVLASHGLYKEALIINKSDGALRSVVSIEPAAMAADYASALTSLVAVDSPDFAYVGTRDSMVFYFIREDGTNTRTLDTLALAQANPDPTQSLYYSGSLITRGASVYSVCTRSFMDPDTFLYVSEQILKELRPDGSGAEIPLESAPGAATEGWGLLDPRKSGADGLSGFVWHYVARWSLTDGSLLSMDDPLAGAGWADYTALAQYRDSAGRVFVWCERFKKNSFAIYNRFLFVQEPGAADAGTAPAVSVPEKGIMNEPLLMKDRLVIATTKGMLQGYELSTGDILSSKGVAGGAR